MLSVSESLIRDVVRLDATVPDPATFVNLPNIAETLSNATIAEGGTITQIAGRLLPAVRTEISDSGVVTARRVRMSAPDASLGERLARVHHAVLGSSSIESMAGTVARCALASELLRIGLVQRTTLPLSLGLLRRLKRYREASAIESDCAELASLFDEVLAASVAVATRLATEGAEITVEWRRRVPARGGTVLDRALSELQRWPTIDSATMLSVTGANKSNVYRALDVLMDTGVVVEISGRAKNRVWTAPEAIRSIEEVTASRRIG